jgi:hypothetical protein
MATEEYRYGDRVLVSVRNGYKEARVVAHAMKDGNREYYAVEYRNLLGFTVTKWLHRYHVSGRL